MVPKSFCESLISNKELNHSSETVHQILESAFSFIIDTVKGGKKVNFPNFIKFDRVTRNARSFKNPTKTKEGEEPVHREDIKKPARYALRVTVMNHLRDAFEDIEIEIIKDNEKPDDSEVEATDATDADADEEVEPQPVKKGKAKAVKAVKEVKAKGKKEEVKEVKAKPAPKSKKSSKNEVVEEVVEEEPEVVVEEKENKEKKEKKKPSKKAKKVDEVDMVQEKYELENLSD